MENRTKIAVLTGSMGFIATHMHNRLLQEGYDVCAPDLRNGNDIRTCELPEKCDIIIHMAAKASIPYSFENPVESFENNVGGTLRMIKYAQETGARIVFSSSSSAKELMSPYAIQKKTCEDLLRFYWDHGVESIALRYFNVFGEGQEEANKGENQLVLAQLLEMYRRNKPFSLVDGGNRRRDFVYVDDVVEANIIASKMKLKKFEVYDVGSGVNHSIKELARTIDPDRPIINLPPRIEPLTNKAVNLLPKWKPKTKVKDWLLQSI